MSMIATFVFVLIFTMIKEAYEVSHSNIGDQKLFLEQKSPTSIIQIQISFMTLPYYYRTTKGTSQTKK